MNRKLLFIIGGIIAIVIALFVVFSSDREIRNYPPKEGPILAFGDSLVEGVGATRGNDFVSILSRKIGEPIINLGRAGDTTAQGLLRIGEALELEPRIVIVLLGGNDFLRKVPSAETFSNLREIVAKFQDSGSAVLVLGVRSGLFSDRADELYESLAEETRSAYVPDVLSGLFGDQRYMSDAIHPNDAGYARIAERVSVALAKLLK